MEYCRKKDVLLQAWSPLAQGVLMGNLGAQPDNIKETAALVQEYAQRHETTAEGILLAWLLKHPAKIQPVLGTTTPNRLRACAKALSVSLSREEWMVSEDLLGALLIVRFDCRRKTMLDLASILLLS